MMIATTTECTPALGGPRSRGSSEGGAALLLLAMTVGLVAGAGLVLRSAWLEPQASARLDELAELRLGALGALLEHRAAGGHGLPSDLGELLDEGVCDESRLVDPTRSGVAGMSAWFEYRRSGGAFGAAQLHALGRTRRVDPIDVDAASVARRLTLDSLARARRGALVVIASGRREELAEAFREAAEDVGPVAACLGLPASRLRDGYGRTLRADPVGALRSAGPDGRFDTADDISW